MSKYVEIRVEPAGQNMLPHTFLVVSDGAGFQQAYGFAPVETGLWGPGHITDDNPHPFEFTSGPIPITDQQYEKLADYIADSINNPPYYSIPAQVQCTMWVNKGLKQAGIWDSLMIGADPYAQTLINVLQKALDIPFSELAASLFPMASVINDLYLAARSFLRKDPLTLDLDGDGIETRAATGDAVTLFDYDRDGIRTGTGWIAPDDGLVVMDRDGNGSIDSGAELFGVDTVLADGSKAADGFAALRDLDSNHDNLFNASDAAYAQVRIWQDANSDGVSQAAELKTLAQQGISAIRLTATPSGQILATQNQIAYTGTYDKTNGTTGTAYAINFADNPFYRQYPDGSTETADNPFAQENAPVQLTPEAQPLPAMQGSGAVRDLREAASLDAGLAQRVQGLIDAGIQSRPQLWAQTDGLAEQWAETSGMQTSIEQAQEHGFVLHYLPPGVMGSKDLYDLYGIIGIGGSGGSSGGGSSTVGDIDFAAEQARTDALKIQSARLERIIGILERYNGMTFVDVSELGATRGNGQLEAPEIMSSSGSGGGGIPMDSPYVLPSLDQYQVEFLERSYAELQQPIYDGLVLETRLKPYLDDIALQSDESGIRLDASAMEQRLAANDSAWREVA